MTPNFSQTAAYIWNLAELLRGDFKQSQYGRIILPFTVLRRLECVLEATKTKVLKEAEKRAGLAAHAREKFLLKAAGQQFYNTSPMDLSKLGSSDIKSNLLKYVESFSKDAREIFAHFRFDEFVTQLNDANLLFKVVKKVAATDLHPETIGNYEMGLVFEELIRRFAESSNETAGEHFTPRDIVRLTTLLVFMEDDEVLRDPGIIRTMMTSSQWISWIENICRAGGGFRFRVSRTMLGNQLVPAPPIEEQTRIADLLDRGTEMHKSLMARSEEAIELLQERRTALISAAVTGKIDVRGWKPPASESDAVAEVA